jgi:hypothetical protein
MFEPIPLEITAILIGVLLVVMQIVDVKTAWAPYMHPVVVFIMCCLIFAIALDKAGITKRLGHFIVAKAGTSVTSLPSSSAWDWDWPPLSCMMRRRYPSASLPCCHSCEVPVSNPTRHSQIYADFLGIRLFMRWHGNAGWWWSNDGFSSISEGVHGY